MTSLAIVPVAAFSFRSYPFEQRGDGSTVSLPASVNYAFLF